MADINSKLVAINENVFNEIKQIITQIKYGSLEISIHNGKIVQIERREKKRYVKGESL
jgi:hypothetical protein